MLVDSEKLDRTTNYLELATLKSEKDIDDLKDLFSTNNSSDVIE